MKTIIKIIASGLGLGYSPIASGTVGSVLGVLIFIGLIQIFPQNNLSGFIINSIIVTILFFIGVFVSNSAEKLYSKKDPGEIVIDEIVGCLVFLLFSPGWQTIFGFNCPRIWYIIVGFLIFRIFDIIKPFPAYQSQQLPGGWGIMVDDLIAGIYTVIVIYLGIFIWSFF